MTPKTQRPIVRRLFPFWTLIVAVVAATAVSGRFADYRDLFDAQVVGSGPPLILIPGLATSGEVWGDTVAQLRDRYELHVLTLAGFGGPQSVGAPFLPRVATALTEYADQHRLERPVLIGHSLGGFVALLAASEAPDRFAGVVSVDGLPFLPAVADATLTAASQADRAAALRTFHEKLDREAYLAQTQLVLTSMITGEADRQRALGWASATDPAAAGLAIAEMLTTDLRGRVGAIPAPILLIGALGSVPEPMREATRAAYRAQLVAAPQAEVVFHDEARHFLMLDAPAFLKAQLDQFLTRALAGRAPAGSPQ